MLRAVALTLYQSQVQGDPNNDRWFELATSVHREDGRLDIVIWEAVSQLLRFLDPTNGTEESGTLSGSITPRRGRFQVEIASSVVARKLYESLRERDPENAEWWWEVGTLMSNRSLDMSELVWESVNQILTDVIPGWQERAVSVASRGDQLSIAGSLDTWPSGTT